MPQLRRPLPSRALREVQGGPGARCSRQPRWADLPHLLDKGPGQPRDLLALRATKAGERPHPRRSAVRDLPAWKVLTCAICGRHGPCLISETTTTPWCRTCTRRWARCFGCGEVAQVRGGTINEPLCATCTRPDPEFWSACTSCGQPGRIHAGRCGRCTVDRRLRELLGDDTGAIHPQHQALYQALATTERPATVAAGLDKSTAPAILSSLEAGDGLTHEALDALPAGKPVEHLRSVLVAIGALPPRDEQMARLERWITRTLAGRSDPEEQQLLQRYAIWHVLRRLRRRLGDTTTTYSQISSARQHIRAAITVLDWLARADLTLATANQGDLEAWLASDEATHRREAGHFVRWARKERMTVLDLPARRWGGPSGVIDTEARWRQARWLLHDDTLKPEDRFAGLLVLLYAQWPAAVSRLTLAHVGQRRRCPAPTGCRAGRPARTARRARPPTRRHPAGPRGDR